MRVIGLDIHRVLAASVLLENGAIRRLGRVGMTRDHLTAFAKTLTHDDHVVEAAGDASAVAEVTRPQQRATCPAGKTSQNWTRTLARGTTPVIKIKFSVADCRACSLWSQCTRSISARRAITIRPEAQHEALRVGRAREQTADFAVEYAWRAGIEGTIAQGVRSSRLRRTPYFGQAKTHLAHLTAAAAMNLVRLLRWLSNEPKV